MSSFTGFHTKGKFPAVAWFALSSAAIWAAGLDASFAPPVAVADTFQIRSGGMARLPVLGNDSGLITASTLVILNAPTSGSVSLDDWGRVVYRHAAGGAAIDSFTYRVSGVGGVSGPATVTVRTTEALRLPGIGLKIPATPPPVALAAVNAFPSLIFSQPICATSPRATLGGYSSVPAPGPSV